MLPPRPFKLAVATCAAASLASLPRAAEEPASVQAAAQLARHAALDARAALGACGSSRSRRLLARGARRLRYSYALTARLLTDHVPSGAPASAIFIQAASEVAHESAALVTRASGRPQALALRVLRRTSRLQEDVALELSTGRSAGSLEDLIEALTASLHAQEALLDTLDAALRHDRISRRRAQQIEPREKRARAARDALRTALTTAHRAVQRPLAEVPAGDDPAYEVSRRAARAQNHSPGDGAHDARPNLS